ncbi:hypothetical protein [Microbacterium ulmi]|uniref:hypothetical protein n=1 Tax=Microbacterium ulmi TaxID=179095 RepID=UPI00147844BC|nr:hypothetical protein [Microbacterium ulmi]
MWIIPVAAYAAILVLLGIEPDASFWTSILFLAVGCVTFAVSVVAVPRTRVASAAGAPPVLVAGIWFAVELILANIFVFAPVPFPVVLICQLVVAVVFLIVLFATMASNEAITAAQDQRSAADVIGSGVARATILARTTGDPGLTRRLQSLAEEFRHSPRRPVSGAGEADAEIAEALDRLESLVHSHAGHRIVLERIAAISGALKARNADLSPEP